jgi:hypothetical protein
VYRIKVMRRKDQINSLKAAYGAYAQQPPLLVATCCCKCLFITD